MMRWLACLSTAFYLTGWVSGTSAQTVDASSTAMRYAIRADPSSDAAAINLFLKKVALPTELGVRKDESVADVLKGRCGADPSNDRAQSATLSITDARNVVQFAPCLRVRANVMVTVEHQDTLGGIAGRLGLNSSSAAQFKSFRGSPPSWRRLRPTDPIRVGDTVVVPQVARWTAFQVDSTKIPTLDGLIFELASQFHCSRQNAERCLLKRNIILLPQHGQAPPVSMEPASSGSGPAKFDFSALERLGTILEMGENGRVREAAAPAPAQSANVPIDSNLTALSPAPAPAIPSTILAAETAPAAVPAAVTPLVPAVAAGQWPYDKALVKATLLATIAAHPDIRPTIIGVADGGLADSSGKPLPSSVFTNIPPDTDSGFVGDVIGAGIERASLPANGDIGLCPLLVDTNITARWPTGTVESASHGTIASAIAAGLPLRTDPSLQQILPALTFFRLSGSDCLTAPQYESQPNEVIEAIEYLYTRASIVNLSYIDLSSRPSFTDTLAKDLRNQPRLLIVPAGNDSADLDSQFECPPCLATPFWPDYEARVGSRIIVVGAATSELKRADYSGSGDQTVRFYAPATTAGAIDILGRDAASLAPATSYAAPYAALAAALLRSLGVTDVTDIAQRIKAASWPLLEDDNDPGSFNHNVIDMTKIAAVRSYAVETLEPDSVGDLIRRTYVGVLSQKLDALAICQGSAIPEASVQAVRLGKPDAAGARSVYLHYRHATRRPGKPAKCHPTGVLHFNDWIVGRKDFPIDTVTEILVPWSPL